MTAFVSAWEIFVLPVASSLEQTTERQCGMVAKGIEVTALTKRSLI